MVITSQKKDRGTVSMELSDAAKRKSLLEAAMKLTMEDLMAIPIVNLSAIWAGNSKKLTYLPRADEDTLAINAIPK